VTDSPIADAVDHREKPVDGVLETQVRGIVDPIEIIAVNGN
jgi:hypothetical protein